ncbi:MAG: serine/threonine protein kinase [Magnetococcales bacterium]|nr:serine/threonine protein kinase [Magnetococcales bacterium]
MEPTQLGRYQIIKRLYQGASGLVYEGLDPESHRRVAIKTVDPGRLAEESGQRLVSRLRYEARLFGSFSHPNIVTLYDYHEEEGRPFIVLELLQGETLKKCLERGLSFGWRASVDLIIRMLDAVSYMHTRGVMHLDLKPANMMLLDDDQVKVTDFGIAQRINAPDIWSSITGTPGYMSPEQLMGHRLDPRSDLFSVAVVLYELLTGVQAFPGKQVPGIMQRVLNLSPQPPSQLQPHLPTALDAVLRVALAKQPADRFQDANLFRSALQQVVEGQPVGVVVTH